MEDKIPSTSENQGLSESQTGDDLATETKKHPPSDLIQVEAWNDEDEDEDEENGTNIGLGPANLIEAFMPAYVLFGTPVEIIVNEKYSLGEESSQYSIQSMNALTILLIIEKVCNTVYDTPTKAHRIGSILVTDGYMSHAISPVKASWEESFRLYYRDPWDDISFLESERNIAGVNARREKTEPGNQIFSLSYGEYEKVIVAIGIHYQSLDRDPRDFIPYPWSKRSSKEI